MSYIGKEPQYTDFLSKFFNGDGTAMTVTLDASPPNEAALLVFIDGVRQDTSAYTVSGYDLTFTGTVPSGTNNVQVVHLGIAQDTQVPVDDSVSTAKIQDDAVTSAKLANALNITSGNSLTIDSGATITNNGTASGFGLFTSYAEIADQKTSGTDGGSSVASAWYTRDLNTEIYDPDGIVSISSNQFTLGAGTYYIVWEVPIYVSDFARTRLTNITDSTHLYSQSNYSASTNSGTQWVNGTARITLASSKVFEIQYKCVFSRAGNGLGRANTSGVPEQYTTVKIFKEA